MRALVLGGGSLKGAFQTGAVQAILETGFVPDFIYGISVGSLNASFLVHEAGRQFVNNETVDWIKVGRHLLEFWIKNITKPEDVAVIRSRFMLGFNTLMSRFDGLLDNTPIQTLVRNNLDLDVLRKSPVRLKVGAVDIINGDMVYVDQQDEHILDYIFASSSLPFLMPAVSIGGDHRKAFLDGGLREVAPLRIAIDDGATEIVCVACHAKRVFNEHVNYRSIFTLVERVKDITINQIVNNDIAWAERFVEREKLSGRDVSLTVIRPDEPLRLNIMKFTPDDIGQLVVQGYRAATTVLKAKGIPRQANLDAPITPAQLTNL
ncbi:patatin-like phospholipase family protein [Tellurirhabdus bombi]|uniref:patatin-like phospholipase family protein n=1 Tax=Tellurirhabdus bombi TaxID=2907205 RepID=UPI001F404D2E|nr:patatin-like phospholipase family protein [Tellurirhabdus bombi]